MRAACSASLLLAGLLAAPGVHAELDAELGDKARAFRAALVDRHLSREGVVLYRIDLRTVRSDLELGTYPPSADVPTFTGLFAAASCTRAGVEADPAEALDDARRALDGLSLLMSVTGEPGFLARCLRRDAGRDTAGFSGKWLPGAAPHTRYVFRADVSADQYANGLLPAVAACARWFPERARALVTASAGHLLANDMKLIDPEGERTRFGDLSWRSGHGLNSIFQLTGYAVFAWAEQLDPDPRWAKQRLRLRDHYRVPARSRTTNLRIGALTNHSNDLMAMNLYRVLIPLARDARDPALADLRHGLHRTWLRVRDDGNAYFAALLCWVEPESCDRAALERGRTLLARFPLDKRRRAPAPELLELPRRWLPGRKGKELARDLVPIELRRVSSLEWKSSPYRTDWTEASETEYTGIDYLLAYWLLRSVDAQARGATPTE